MAGSRFPLLRLLVIRARRLEQLVVVRPAVEDALKGAGGVAHSGVMRDA